MRRLFALLALLALPAAAEEAALPERIVAGLSQSRVAITTDFTGSEILVYGAIAREAPPPAGAPLGVIVTVEGPRQEIVVRKKEYRYGIWLNTDKAAVDSAPSFYAAASTGTFADTLRETDDLRHRITLGRVIRAVDTGARGSSQPFVEALMRIRAAEGHYLQEDRGVMLTQDTLFRADVKLPANLIEGDYRVRIFLTRDGRVTDQFERSIFVRKEGLERLFFRMAQDQPLLYGMLSLVVAALAGWGASAAFQRLRS